MVLGQGRPLFEAPGVRMDLRGEGTRTFGNGVVFLHYSSDGAIDIADGAKLASSRGGFSSKIRARRAPYLE
ncbi:hypothetical protein [Arthrobacter ginsengisoli]|uniref:hypothetical protein n=1 Tax=Arthrobacter ginsengisoli TaxID=1356565 RepID=UPI00286B8228|nr:hypothetical protein [Arthrobacter ginsengisoli]